MTNKKENILQTALELFASEGYASVSTNSIAKKAGVSEGLIFRHFESKKGLLDAIVKDGEQRMKEVLTPFFQAMSPGEIIRTFILLPFQTEESEYDYWKLQYKLKWEPEYNAPEKMKPVEEKLAQAFRELEFENPVLEAQLLIQIFDSIAVGILRDGKAGQEPLLQLLLTKYDL